MRRLFLPARALRFLAPTSAVVAAAALVGLLAGCATTPAEPAMTLADYAAALGPWQGQPESALVDRWGPPQAVEDGGAGRWLVYVTTADSGSRTTLSIGIGGFGIGGGGHSSVGVGAGATFPVGGEAPAGGCATRFLVEHGVVTQWRVDGAGCRRPILPS